MNANEIQSVTTSLRDVNEVQIITTSATAIGEIQAITLSPPPGQSSLDPRWSFSLSLDTSFVGGSLQYSGQISVTAKAMDGRDSVSSILGAMLNMDGTPSVIKKPKNEDGGYTYLVLFPTSMKDVPQLDVYLADIPVSIVTLQNGNVLGGSFRLEFQGETTSDIPYDADAAEIQQQLEMLSTVGKVSVYRSNANEQNGYSWEVEFLSDQNSGDLENLITHGELLTTTNPDGHANIEISPGGIDGSYIKGSFQLEFQGEVTLPIDSNADVTTMKLALESLSTVGNVKVSRSEESIIGGYTWFITFLKNHYCETSTGDLPPLSSLSQLTGGSGGAPTIEVREIRKRSRQEVQTIRIFAGGDEVDPLSKFKLNFMGQSTAEIRALPLGGKHA